MTAETTNKISLTLTTAQQPGAVAILQLHGPLPQLTALLKQLTGRANFQAAKTYLTDYADIDHGLTTLLPVSVQTANNDVSAYTAQLTPHGGLRVVQKIIDHLITLGAVYDPMPPATAIYPEASTALEADMLYTIANASSPAAIGLLAQQPKLWRKVLAEKLSLDFNQIEKDTVVLNRLIVPPTIAVVGQPNVGKSALLNYLTGQNTAIVADLPGTTRDWVGALVELNCNTNSKCDANQAKGSSNPFGAIGTGVAVQWFDTPGLRESNDAIEQEAIKIARSVLRSADILISLRDLEQDFPDLGELSRKPDIDAINKIDTQAQMADLPDHLPEATIAISAHTGYQIDELQNCIMKKLGVADFLTEKQVPLWAFSDTLRSALQANDIESIRDYIGESI